MAKAPEKLDNILFFDFNTQEKAGFREQKTGKLKIQVQHSSLHELPINYAEKY
jgi:hypothetical protein